MSMHDNTVLEDHTIYLYTCQLVNFSINRLFTLVPAPKHQAGGGRPCAAVGWTVTSILVAISQL